MTAVPAPRAEETVGCVLARETGVLVVLTDVGPVRASYGAGMLGQLARDRSRVPEPGEWVVLRRWYDGPVTVEATLTPRQPRIAPVVPLRASGPRGRR